MKREQLEEVVAELDKSIELITINLGLDGKLHTQHVAKIARLQEVVGQQDSVIIRLVDENDRLKERLDRTAQRLLEVELKLQQAANEWFGVVKPPYMPGPPGPKFAPFTVTCHDTIGPAL